MTDSRRPPEIAEVCARRTPGRTPVALAVLGVAVVGLAAAVLYFFNPSQHGFYPFCVFHRMTGLQCAGCGSLRALHQLLHGNVLEALRLNALTVLALPLFAWPFARAFVRRFGRELPAIRVRPGWLWAGLVVLVLFSVLRNLA